MVLVFGSCGPCIGAMIFRSKREPQVDRPDDITDRSPGKQRGCDRKKGVPRGRPVPDSRIPLGGSLSRRRTPRDREGLVPWSHVGRGVLHLDTEWRDPVKPRTVTVLYLSGSPAGSGCLRNRFEGGAHLLHKSFTVVELLETVQKVMHAAV